MHTDSQHPTDDSTVMVFRDGHTPATAALTDVQAPPKIEQLAERMIYSARVKPADAFSVSVNPLVAAASEVLSFVVHIKHSTSPDTLVGLHGQLTAAIKAFEANALCRGVDSQHMMKARYVLCTVVDEAVVTTRWGKESEWSQQSLLSSFHNETFGGEKVFQVLDQLCKDPVYNLSLLELIYLCLALGFEGKFRVIERGIHELDGIRDALYRQIRHLRGDVARELSPHWQGLKSRRHRLTRIVPGWLLATFTAGCLVVMFSGFAWVLGEQRDVVLQPYQQLDTPVVRAQL
ncbi:DotU family type IV/VI secretion system protein [Pseudomonas helleri]|uniref:type IVB secretion system protein IcmH/DotU n=1 Tax=Pseudomonas helleri TaxID=1608996 RepID=UPI001294EA07|nr:type IVB secretion system protein IcmH/DotU [Pseudomonas helleri]MQU58823.1 DotU family type IV/VI secretion system protein [Pseudomonas helleri]